MSSLPRRRPRYRGAHPRRFHEKYKEHDPGRYADEAEKVRARGKTPAGTHRPVMVPEVLAALAPRPGEIAVDATLGYGGHTRALLQAVLPGGRVLGLDADPIELPKTEAMLRAEGFQEAQFEAHRTNFAGLAALLVRCGLFAADVILADLGVSSMQLDNPDRGFGCKEDGPLDMRMNPHHGRPASAWLDSLTEAELTGLLISNADEPRAQFIARAVLAAHRLRPIVTTHALAQTIRRALAGARPPVVAAEVSVRRVFQALRIAVNDEFGALDSFLHQLPSCLRAGGRVAVLTFHSGEDRRVKKALQAGLRAGVYSRISEEVVRPGRDEVNANPRAASAKLRWAVRSGASEPAPLHG